MRRLLIEVAYPVAEHGSRACALWELRPLVGGLSCSVACGTLCGLTCGIKSMSPALAGGFLIPGPPGKSPVSLFF